MLKVIKFREKGTDLVRADLPEENRSRVSTGLCFFASRENEAHRPSSMGADRDGLDLLSHCNGNF